MKVRLKDVIGELGGTLYEVNLSRSHEEERPTVKHSHRTAQPSSAVASEAQKAQRQLFKEAIAYAQAVLENPDLRAVYEKKAKTENKSAHNLAMSDYLQGKNLFSKG